MSVKVCQKCKTPNAVGNSACIKCGERLNMNVSQPDKKFGHLFVSSGKNIFSKLLFWATIICVILALAAVIKMPLFQNLQILN